MLCCTVWCALVIPLSFRAILCAQLLIVQANISTKLLFELQQSYDDPMWNEHTDLLLWLVYMGGAFSPTGPVRSGYIALLQSERFGASKSWMQTYEILRDFIWSDVAFRIDVRKLWEEAYPEVDRKENNS
jgi:hypothetical protein